MRSRFRAVIPALLKLAYREGLINLLSEEEKGVLPEFDVRAHALYIYIFEILIYIYTGWQ